MKKLIFIIQASFFILVFNSCNDEVDEALNKELFNKIVGRWELVSESIEYYHDNILLTDTVKYDFPYIPEDDTVYLTHLNFKNIGSVGWDNDDGFEEHWWGYKWGVDDNKFWIIQPGIGENHCEIHKLTDTRFQFTHTYKGRTAYGSIQTKDITTYELKR